MRSVSPKRRGRGLLVALAVAALAISACSSGNAQDQKAKDSGEAQALTVDTSFVVKTLDPGAVYEPTGNLIVHALYSTLVTFDGSDISKPVPELAKSFTPAPDGKTFTFALDPAAKFSDGSAVTAADVIFSLTRLKNLKGSASAIVGDLSFSSTDDHTVVVTSATVNPNVPTILAMPFAGILNSKLALKNGGVDGTGGTDAAAKDKLSNYLNTAALGSGPYVIESFDSASRIVLAENKSYWRTKPKFGRVVFQNMDVQNQKLTMSKLPKSEIAMDLAGTLLAELPSELQQSGSPDSYYQLRLDADPAVSKVTSNPDWVAAVQAAMDYPGMASLFGPAGKAAGGIIPTAFAGSLPASEAQTQDLAAAKAALAKSGVGDQSVKLLYPAITFGGIDLGTIATKVQSDAAKAGIKIVLDPAPIASFLDQRKSGKVPFSFSPQFLNYPVAASAVADLMPGGATAKSAGWTAQRADPATVAAADKVLASVDATEQATLLQDWQRLMIHHSPYITLVYNSTTVVASANLTGVDYSAAGWNLDIGDVSSK